MDLIIALSAFAVCMAASLILGVTMLIPLGIGFLIFTYLAVRRGFSLKKVLGFAAESLRDSFVVIGILVIIGCLTGLWRQSGTVAYFVTLGVSAIPPRIFVLAAFLLTAVMSYALGTSFGVTATAGVILMSIARAGGVNTVLAAGAIFSGVYVGDRGSPAASSGNLVAVITHTDMRKNVRKMLKCSLVPFFACCLIYGLLSLGSPMHETDTAMLGSLSSEFRLSWYCLIPAVLMIILPFCGLEVRWAMAVSLVSSVLTAVFLQHESVLSCLRTMLLGYTAKDPSLAETISGGGIVSMLEVCGILLISCSYGSIFQGTGMLAAVNERVSCLAGKTGRYPVMLLLGAALTALFCNQTIGVIMQSNLAAELYGDGDAERSRKMLDIENSAILEAGLVPWCIACSVPLAMLGADYRSALAGFYLWLVPLWWGIKKYAENTLKNISFRLLFYTRFVNIYSAKESQN